MMTTAISHSASKLISLLSVLIAFIASPLMALEVGDRAPDFMLEATDGNSYTLSQFAGEKTVVLAWFPKAFTQGCTIECKSLAENGHLIQEYNARYFMISVDPLDTNMAFATEHGADFPLLSDPSTEVAQAYEVLGSRGVANRHTFYIDEKRIIVAIDRAINTATSAEDMAATLGQLGVAKIQ